MALLDQTQVAALLGRPLTATESTNFNQYIEIAEKRLSNLLCFSLTPSETPEARVYDTRDGYRTAYVDPFTSVTAVKTGDTVRTGDWIKKQNDSYQGDWYNVIEFDERLHGERIEVTATWGFTELPADLGPLLAGLFGLNEKALSSQGVKRKEIEDYRVEYDGTSDMDNLLDSQAGTIAKYAQCERAVQHGCTVRPIYYY